MSGVFLSYRRDDTAQDARRIHDRLTQRFGDDLVYIDVEDIPLGVNFIEHITAALRDASYVLIAIGPRWLLVTDEAGRRRLQDPDDPVRYEIRTALEHKRLVVPMLIGGANMPSGKELPSDISELVLHNGIAIRPDPDFEADVTALMDGLHLDRIDEQRVPVVFQVGLVARNLGYGGAVGWGILGAIAGAAAFDERGPLALVTTTLVGAVVGWIGGWLVGFFTGQLIKHKAPPLVARRVRRMGIVWSLGLVTALAVAAGIGAVIGNRIWGDMVAQAGSFGEAIGAIIAGIFVFVLVIVLVALLGLFIGSGITAAFFARWLRLRSDQISRGRGIAIALVWLLGGLVTGIGWLIAVATVAQIFQGS